MVKIISIIDITLLATFKKKLTYEAIFGISLDNLLNFDKHINLNYDKQATVTCNFFTLSKIKQMIIIIYVSLFNIYGRSTLE